MIITDKKGSPLKVRIGIGLGAWPFGSLTSSSVLEFIDCCEALDIDSIWLSDRIAGKDNLLEPIAFMAFMASRMKNMMFGTSVLVLPVRNPVIVAKELATLDILSEGRLLPAVGLGPVTSVDFQATGIKREERGRRTDEAIRLIKRLWTEQDVTFVGKYYSVENLTITPKPYKVGGPPIWIGGRSEAAWKRAGRLGDGWLVSSITASETALGVNGINKYAAEAGRQIQEDHFGVYLPFLFTDNPAIGLEQAKPYLNSRSDVYDSEIAAIGTPETIRERILEYMRSGATKFVMRPACHGNIWYKQLELLAKEVIEPLQTPFTAQERQKREGLTS